MNLTMIKTVKLLLVLVLQGLILSGCSGDKDWRTASRESAGIVPDPTSTNEAILQIYGAKAYPWEKTYKAFPGPNSNTFIGWIARKIPELQLDLPFSSIGSGYGD